MQLKTILNRIQKFKSFVYQDFQLVEQVKGLALMITILPRANSKPICSGCGRRRPVYDTMREARSFTYVPLWGIPVYFLYRVRRVHCPTCKVVVEKMPWAQGKCHLTHTFVWFLARWAQRLSWSEVAQAFLTSWDNVYRSVEKAVQWGLDHRSLEGITAIGVDEIAWKKGHHYLTLVYQIDQGCKRLLWIGQERTEQTLRGFFVWLGKKKSKALRFVCSDMWKPYLKVIAEKAGGALNILDRYHIMAKMNQAIDKVRAQEAKELKKKKQDHVLKRSRWILLKRPEHLTQKQEVKLAELLRCNLKTVRSYLLKEQFQQFWEYKKGGWAVKFMERWCRQVMYSKIDPMKKIAKMLRKHKPLIANWFKAKKVLSLGTVEGLNNKVRTVTKKSYGFRTLKATKLALFHNLGKLPQPEQTHRFC